MVFHEKLLWSFLSSDRDIPSQKLLALQKVLESDFFNAVREVYEHVHETVDIQGDPEVRANATAKVWIGVKEVTWVWDVVTKITTVAILQLSV